VCGIDAPRVTAKVGEFQLVGDVSGQLTVGEPAGGTEKQSNPSESVIVDFFTDRAGRSET
jgi:hypothetical protein